MIKARLSYHLPESLKELLDLLENLETNRPVVLGGGTVALPELVYGLRDAEHVIDLARLGLDHVRLEGDMFAVGARATYRDVLGSEEVSYSLPNLYVMASGITGGNQLRNLATLVGSACYAKPTSDVPACLVSLGATMRIIGSEGERCIPASDFFRGAFETGLREREVLMEIRIPKLDSEDLCGYYKLKFSESSWPIATAALTCRLEGDGSYALSLALGGVAPRPVEVGFRMELDEMPEIAVSLRRAVEEASWELWTDELASGEYRQSIAGVVARRAAENLVKVGE